MSEKCDQCQTEGIYCMSADGGRHIHQEAVDNPMYVTQTIQKCLIVLAAQQTKQVTRIFGKPVPA